MSNAASDQDRIPRGTSLMPRDFDEQQLAAAPVLVSLEMLMIEELSEDEDQAFVVR